MRVRAVVGGIFTSAAILGIGWQFGSAAATTFADQAATTSTGSSTTASSTTASSTGSTATASATPTATPSSSATASGSVSGTFVGATESTRYGDVQVEIVVVNGTITDVKALHLTDQDNRSVQISNQAAPILRSEVLASQSAHVSSVSGATYTTDGYLASVQSAIDKAGL